MDIQLTFPSLAQAGQLDGQCFLFFPNNDNCVEYTETVRLMGVVLEAAIFTQEYITYVSILDDDSKEWIEGKKLRKEENEGGGWICSKNKNVFFPSMQKSQQLSHLLLRL